MRDLQMYAAECMEELDAIGIPYGNIVEFKVNTRAKRRWGLSQKTPNGFIIEINVDLLNEQNSINGLKNTIIHEILHTCTDCMNHGDRWKYFANVVNNTYGYNVKRCSNAEEKGVNERREAPIRPYKYLVQCPECGAQWKRKRESKLVQMPFLYRCGKCNVSLVSSTL